MNQTLLDKNPLINSQKPAFKWRGIHLDLKGVAPTPKRLIELLEKISFAGYNMVLVEWEDMFPWQVDDNFQNSEAYSQSTLDEFYKKADKLGLEIIPLVQVLGHMETFLSPEKYHHMREVADKSDVINPLAYGAQDLITSLVEEIAQRTPNIKYLHLGGDEAWTFGSHPDTKAFIEQNSKAKLYLKHIEPTLEKLGKQNIRPILWHDMMIDWEDDALKKIGKKADIMAWGYGPTPNETDRHYSTKYIERFYKNNVTLWGAGAYKGADGPSADIPDLSKREHNALGWVDVGKRLNFKGLVATAWSRYSTHRMQCEPIDGALDALFMIGAIFYLGESIGTLEESKNKIEKSLEACGENKRFRDCKSILEKLAENRIIAWQNLQMLLEQKSINKYHTRDSAPEIESAIQKNLNSDIQKLEYLKGELVSAFNGLLTDKTINEYIQTRLGAVKAALKCLE